MTPPLADPHGHGEHRAPKPPFRGLKIFVTTNVALSLMSALTLFFDPELRGNTGFLFGILLFVAALVGFTSWGLWRGSNVARLVYWWFTLLSVFILLASPPSYALPAWLFVSQWCGYAFTAFSLVWLLLPGVKAHFKRDRAL